jgi:uncharacterized protein YhfF
MRTLQLGQPGPDRRRLTKLVLAGHKTTTARPWKAGGAYEQLEAVGERLLLIDHSGRSVAVLEIDAVRLTTIGAVDDPFGMADDPDDSTVEAWRTVVEQDWASLCPLTDDTPLVCVRFHVVGRDDTHG